MKTFFLKEISGMAVQTRYTLFILGKGSILLEFNLPDMSLFSFL